MSPPADDTLLTLKDACEIFFRGKVTVATLKAEHARGNLDMSKIGRCYWTTIAKLKEMEARCRVEAPAQSSGSIKSARPGLSSTVESEAAQDAVLLRLSERKKLLGITSRRSTR